MSIVSRAQDKVINYKNRDSLQSSRSIRWRRVRDRPTLKDKVIRQQYLTLYKEKILIRYVLEYVEREYPLFVKSLWSFVLIIIRYRGSDDSDLYMFDKNWLQSFYKRHSILKTKTVKTLNRVWHDNNIYGKVVNWFTLMDRELYKDIQSKNIYNMNETSILLSHLTFRKVLVSSHDLKRYREVASKSSSCFVTT